MPKEQMITIEKKDLVAKVAELRKQENRLVQICCTTLADSLEITYSFDRQLDLTNLRLTVPKSDPVIPSLTGEYLAAFTYENELQDLFGLKVTDLALDFKGNFYHTAVKTPFNIDKNSPAA